jgi:hypothetical protein
MQPVIQNFPVNRHHYFLKNTNFLLLKVNICLKTTQALYLILSSLHGLDTLPSPLFVNESSSAKSHTRQRQSVTCTFFDVTSPSINTKDKNGTQLRQGRVPGLCFMAVFQISSLNRLLVRAYTSTLHRFSYLTSSHNILSRR